MTPSHPTPLPGPRNRFGKFNDIARLARACLLWFLAIGSLCLSSACASAAVTNNAPGVAVLLVDTDRVMGKVEAGVYGQFLEHINHSAVDGLFAELIHGRGFEGTDFQTYWNPFATNGSASVVNAPFQSGEKSLRHQADNGTAGNRSPFLTTSHR